MDYNKAIVVGNLTRDPETKKLPSGDTVCNFSVASNRTWKGKDGSKQQEAEFHNVVVFGKTADSVAQYMRKGSEILVEGRLKTSSWEQEGVKKYKTEIVAEKVQFGSKKNNEGSQQNNQGGGYQPTPAQAGPPNDSSFDGMSNLEEPPATEMPF